jgi:hypothetical protein
MAKNDNLHKAKDAKNDEFYTRIEDVAEELRHYKKHFAGKVVFCNCDDPTWSAFWRYFHLNFAELGLKKLISTHYDRTEPTYKMEYEGGDDNNVEVGVKTPLEGSGDFRNAECIKLLDECDIVVTNPPWSMFREYVSLLVEHKKQFVIIGNKNSITYKEFFPLLKDNHVWIGYMSPSEFDTPSGMTKKVAGLGRWFTNLDIQKRHEKLILWQRYYDDDGNPLPDVEERYPHYFNYDGINVDKVADIPTDYQGIIGVPITFLDKYNPEQFEIIGLGIANLGLSCGVKPYNKAHKTYVVRKMLKDRGLIINFSERQLLKVWKERKKQDTNTVENTRYETLASTLESLVKAGVDVQLEMPEEEKVAKPEPDPEEEKPQFDKRIPYTVIRSSRLSKPNDVRYIVVNLNDKDQVLDDASGYGYKSISAAQKGYGYKCRNLAKYGETKHSSKPKTNIPVSQSRQLSFGDF